MFYRYLVGLKGWNPPVEWLLAAQNNTFTKEKGGYVPVRGGISKCDLYFGSVEKQSTA